MKSLKLLKLFVVIAIITATCLANQSLSYVYGMENSKVIAHAGGMVGGLEASNSVEALQESIKNGFELIELDISLTSDNEIVMVHDWVKTSFHYLGEKRSEPVTLKEFESYKNLASPEPLTLTRLIEVLKENPNARIVTDTKLETVNILTKIAKSYPEYIDRFVPQIYYLEEYEDVKKLGYKDIILTLYLHNTFDVEKIINFANEKKLYGVTMPSYDADKGFCKTMSENGVNVFVHPINTKEDADKYFKMGAKKIYSPTLLPKELESFEKSYYLQVTENGTNKKLVDETYEASIPLNGHVVEKDEHPMNIHNLKVAGLKAEEKARITFESSQDLKLSELGAKMLKLDIFNKSEEKLGSLNYPVLQTEKEFRILQEKMSYRLTSLKEHKEIENLTLSKDAKNIFMNSIVVKKGESIYYDCGVGKVFMNGKDRFPVRSGPEDRALIPMVEVLTDLGAESVDMNSTNAIEVSYKGDNYRVPVGGFVIKKGLSLTSIKTPAIVYSSKSMASTEVIQVITKRAFIEDQDIVIILPSNSHIKNDMRNEIVEAAVTLF